MHFESKIASGWNNLPNTVLSKLVTGSIFFTDKKCCMPVWGCITSSSSGFITASSSSGVLTIGYTQRNFTTQARKMHKK